MSNPQPISRRATLSNRATTLYAAVTAISFSATSSAPTPLYRVYQRTMDLSPLTVTVVFAVYAVTIVVAFLTVARLSDYVGRKPMILAALLLNALALVIFIVANGAGELILARAVQGVATGVALTSLGAAILDTDRANGAIYNSVTAFIGLMLGSLLAGALVAWAPLPTELVYVVLLGVSLAEAMVLVFTPETTTGKPGGLAVLIPHVTVPAAALPLMLRLAPLNVAGWALGGFYLSLMPVLVGTATGVSSPFVGAAVVSALMLTAAMTVFALRARSADRLLVVASVGLGCGIAATLVGVALQSAAVMLLGTIIAGCGFGSSYAGNLRALLPLACEQERAGLLAAYFVESYAAFAVPAVIAGMLVPAIGLVGTSYLYGSALIVLSIISFVTTRQQGTRRPTTTESAERVTRTSIHAPPAR